MKKKFITAYCIFVSLIFVFSIFIFAYNVFFEYKNGQSRADTRFEYLSLSIKQLSMKKEIGSRDFYNQLNEIIGSYDDFAALKISYNNEVLLAYPQLNIDEISNTKFIKDYKQTFMANDAQMLITGKLFTLRPTSIGKYARISFLIILVVSIITILLIIVLNATEKNNYIEYKDDSENLQKDELEENSEDEIHTVNEILNASSPVQKNIIDNNQLVEESKCPLVKENESEKESENESVQNSEKINNDKVIININLDTKPQNIVNAPEASDQKLESKVGKVEAKLPIEDIKPMPIEKENPKGLFSPETGLGWESYFKTRLENELNRAISSEIDLALFLIKIPGLERNCAVIKKICDYLITQFQFKDLLFEYKDDSIAAIKIGTNVDQALTLAETINKDINDLLADYPTKSFIGISTRTIRMMSAERLLKEADEALVHAQEEEDSPIIAFRADAIKYQQFLEKVNND